MRVRFSKAVLAKVIVFAIGAIALTLLLAAKIGNLRPFAHTYTLHARFADAAGVFKGDAVKLAGVDIGRVDGATIDHGQALVTFTVDRSAVLPRDTVAGIRWRNVLGQRFLYLYPGRGGGPSLANGATIPIGQTIDAGDLNEFLDRLGPILKAIDPDKANAFIDAIDTAITGNEANVRGLLDNTGTLAQSLASMDSKIQTLISSSDTVMSTYASQDHAIAQILDDLDVVGGHLDQMTGDVNSVITNFADVQQQLDKLLTENRGNIDATLQELDSVASNLSKNRSRLAQVLCTLPAGVAPYFQTTSWGEWFNVRITEFEAKDSNGKVISSFKESSRPHDAQPPYTHCAGGPGSSGSGASNGSGASGGSGGSSGGSGRGGGAGAGGSHSPKAPGVPGLSGVPAPGGASGFDDVRSFVDFVLRRS